MYTSYAQNATNLKRITVTGLPIRIVIATQLDTDPYQSACLLDILQLVPRRNTPNYNQVLD